LRDKDTSGTRVTRKSERVKTMPQFLEKDEVREWCSLENFNPPNPTHPATKFQYREPPLISLSQRKMGLLCSPPSAAFAVVSFSLRSLIVENQDRLPFSFESDAPRSSLCTFHLWPPIFFAPRKFRLQFTHCASSLSLSSLPPLPPSLGLITKWHLSHVRRHSELYMNTYIMYP
jgi:hypothetical protein